MKSKNNNVNSTENIENNNVFCQFWGKSKKTIWICFSIILFITCLLAIWKVWSCLKSRHFDIIINNIDFIIFLSVVIPIVLLLIYYFGTIRRGARQESFAGKIGYDISRLLGWFFSANGLLLVIVVVIVYIAVNIIYKVQSKDGGNELQLLSITMTITLSTLIPTLISRIVARNQLNDIIEKKIDTELSNYKTSLSDIRKGKGHASRMSAEFLEQISRGHKDPKAQDNAAWSIGWASDAVIQYILIHKEYGNYMKNSASCLNIINRAANHINFDNGQVTCRVKFNDLKSLTTMYALIKMYRLADLFTTEAIKQRANDSYTRPKRGYPAKALCDYSKKSFELEKVLHSIGQAFYNSLNPKEQAEVVESFCSITGQSDDFNKELGRFVKDIIDPWKTNLNQRSDIR